MVFLLPTILHTVTVFFSHINQMWSFKNIPGSGSQLTSTVAYGAFPAIRPQHFRPSLTTLIFLFLCPSCLLLVTEVSVAHYLRECLGTVSILTWTQLTIIKLLANNPLISPILNKREQTQRSSHFLKLIKLTELGNELKSAVLLSQAQAPESHASPQPQIYALRPSQQPPPVPCANPTRQSSRFYPISHTSVPSRIKFITILQIIFIASAVRHREDWILTVKYLAWSLVLKKDT